ncbi:MAG: sulfotransferase [Dechloromonas sp.]|nr:sulfotransferase [Dechloromonas sp.]
MTSARTRTSHFSRNAALETLLQDINNRLGVAEQQAMTEHFGQGMRHPLIFVMGPLRSGTTLFMQWLAQSGLFGYPSNLLSRFYGAPIIGAKIQLLLTDPRFNFRDELNDLVNNGDFNSNNGKTKGSLSPHEFWYFWRRFLADPERDIWSDDELRDTFDTVALQSEINGLIDVFDRPFAAKGMLFNYNIPFLDSIFEKALFIQLKRDTASNAASILEARQRQFGNTETWYSFDIPERVLLESASPEQQAIGQVEYINAAIERGMAKLSPERKMHVSYEDFCRHPQPYFAELLMKTGLPAKEYRGPTQFEISRKLPR